MQDYHIAPSLLAADFARLGEDADAVLRAGADRLHLDVMDNHYVPNLTVGPMVCEALRRYGIDAPIDVHLMTHSVDRLIDSFAKAGATSISFHPDATDDVLSSLIRIRQAGCLAGIAINPDTSVQVLQSYWKNIDYVLMMSVNPGFGGQAFINATLDKISYVRQLIIQHNSSIRLAVDGGIKLENIQLVARAGADTFIAGSAIFSQANYQDAIYAMRNKLKGI